MPKSHPYDLMMVIKELQTCSSYHRLTCGSPYIIIQKSPDKWLSHSLTYSIYNHIEINETVHYSLQTFMKSNRPRHNVPAGECHLMVVMHVASFAHHKINASIHIDTLTEWDDQIRHKIIKSFNELWARNPSFTPRQMLSHVYPNWNLGWNNNHRSEKPFHRGNINYSSKCCLLIWLQVYKTLKDTLLLPWQPMACCLRWTRTIKGRAPNYYDVLKKSLMTFRNVEASSGLYSSPVAPFTNMVYPSMDK